MISGAEFRLACRGLLLLARLDQSFLGYFDRSAAGALRSFWLALLILPYFAFQLWLQIDASVPDPVACVASRGVGYAYGWIVFPYVLLLAGKLLQREAEAPGCIAIYNWFMLIWITLQFPALLLSIGDPASQLAGALSLVALIISMVIEGFLLMRCLRILLWQAALLTIVDVFLSLYVLFPLFQAIGCAG